MPADEWCVCNLTGHDCDNFMKGSSHQIYLLLSEKLIVSEQCVCMCVYINKYGTVHHEQNQTLSVNYGPAEQNN